MMKILWIASIQNDEMFLKIDWINYFITQICQVFLKDNSYTGLLT